MDQNNKDKLRLQLDDMLTSNIPDKIETDVNTNDILDKKPVKTHDYTAIRNKSKRKAERAVNSLMRFYLSEAIIEKEEYIQLRGEYEKMTLTALTYQLQTAELAITTLLETIDSGDLTARMFEVLGTLQKSMLDIIKTQTMSLIAAEETFKKLSYDIDTFKPNISSIKGNEDSTVSSRGTKDIMRAIRGITDDNELNNNNVDKIDFSEEE